MILNIEKCCPVPYLRGLTLNKIFKINAHTYIPPPYYQKIMIFFCKKIGHIEFFDHFEFLRKKISKKWKISQI
jgi:hypothetical protein